MTADVELLPLPSVLLNWPHPTNHVAIRDYARANVAHATAPLQDEVEALRAEVGRLNRILGRIVEGDGDSTLVIRVGADAFAAAREYLLRDKEEGHEQ